MSVALADIVATLIRYPNGLTAKQVSEILGIGRQTASNRLSRAAVYCYVEKIRQAGKNEPIYRTRRLA
jgi:DNA-binding transcriptional regulator LsrR (DeoR family)